MRLIVAAASLPAGITFALDAAARKKRPGLQAAYDATWLQARDAPSPERLAALEVAARALHENTHGYLPGFALGPLVQRLQETLEARRAEALAALRQHPGLPARWDEALDATRRVRALAAALGQEKPVDEARLRRDLEEALRRG
ncbi:MAG: hypothetical protein FJ086_07715 [Deltaproteobacteria bacterium]|nr:hypothetical protein [Deltaproteobacteria bacterium]